MRPYREQGLRARGKRTEGRPDHGPLGTRRCRPTHSLGSLSPLARAGKLGCREPPGGYAGLGGAGGPGAPVLRMGATMGRAMGMLGGHACQWETEWPACPSTNTVANLLRVVVQGAARRRAAPPHPERDLPLPRRVEAARPPARPKAHPGGNRRCPPGQPARRRLSRRRGVPEVRQADDHRALGAQAAVVPAGRRGSIRRPRFPPTRCSTRCAGGQPRRALRPAGMTGRNAPVGASSPMPSGRRSESNGRRRRRLPPTSARSTRGVLCSACPRIRGTRSD